VTAGFLSPLPPAPSGVADYSAALLEAMRKLGRVETDATRADVWLYHLGNNPLHGPMYEAALARPGVVVLHDAVLHHFLLGRLDRDAYIEEFIYNYGEWTRDLARTLWDGRRRSALDARYFERALVRRVAECSRAVIVHNPGAAAIVASHAPAAKVVEIPHLFAPPRLPRRGEVERWRAAQGIAPGAFLFGVFGHLRESKRLPSILKAFACVRQEAPKAALLVAGDFVSSDLERALSDDLRAPGVLRLPYLGEREFWLAASAVDACVNLRHPAAGETSGIAIRLMGIGKPVILQDSAETSRLPSDSCLKLETGVAEAGMLSDYMMWLAVSRQPARQIGERAAAHILRHHSAAEAARRYWEVLCACC
jgi:glycosyltransferase involved in cell wall biosynthesis